MKTAVAEEQQQNKTIKKNRVYVCVRECEAGVRFTYIFRLDCREQIRYCFDKHFYATLVCDGASLEGINTENNNRRVLRQHYVFHLTVFNY